MLALQDEHSAAVQPAPRPPPRRGRGVGARATGADGDRADRATPTSAERLTQAATELEVAQLLEARTTWMEASGRGARWPRVRWPSCSAPRRSCAAAEDLTELVGPDALRSRVDPTRLAARPDRARAALLARHHDLRRHQRGAAQHHRPAPVRSAALVRSTTHPVREGLNLLDGTWYADDPHEVWSWMRREAPVYYDEAADVWGISRYDDVLAIEKDPATFSSRGRPARTASPADDDLDGRSASTSVVGRWSTAASRRGGSARWRTAVAAPVPPHRRPGVRDRGRATSCGTSPRRSR